MMLTILLIILGLLALVGVYWTGFWVRNWDFLKAFHKERRARKDV